MNAYVINWYGPYDDTTIKEVEFSRCLYMITGYSNKDLKKINKGETTDIQKTILYSGITMRKVRKRMNDGKHKHWSLESEPDFWIGKVEIATTSRYLLEKIEHIIINFWSPKLNSRKKLTQPKHKLVLVNQWRFPDKTTRVIKYHVAQKLPDLIFFNGEEWYCSEKLVKFE